VRRDRAEAVSPEERDNDMPVIDIHEHLTPRRGFVDPKRGETVTTAEELIAVMDRVGIDMMAVLPLASPETFDFVQSVEEVFEACDRYPGRFIKFCHVDPRLGHNCLARSFTPILNYFKSLGAKGIGEMTFNLWWDDPRVQNLLRDCEATGLPFTFHIATHEFNTYGIITEPGMTDLERQLIKYPKLQFLGHSAGWWSEVAPNPTAEERDGYPKTKIAPGGRVPELMRKYDNIWGDLSAGSGFNAVSRDPEWGYRFIEEFQDRLLMGLDICYPSNAKCELVHWLREALKKGKISRVAFDKIMGENAVRLLGL